MGWIKVASLRQKLRANDRLNGVFLKTPSPHMVELSAFAGSDFVVPDMEHAPLNLSHIDMMVGFAGRSGIPVLPRVPSHDPSLIGRLLDVGATGVLVPRVSSVDQAKAIIAAARFAQGERGFSPSPRAGGYGRFGADKNLKSQTETPVVALQIEDRLGVEAVADIAALNGVDALFVGPVDLSMSLGVAMESPALEQAIQDVRMEGQKRGLACGIFVPSGAVAAKRAAQGFTWFIIGSDQSHYQAALQREIAASA